MKLKASTAVEAKTLELWLTQVGHTCTRTGFTFTTPTPDDPSNWLAWLVASARLNGDDLSGVQLGE